MPVSKDIINKLIKNQLPDAIITIISLKNDDDHYQATVSSRAFIGLSRIQQHRLVYQALGDVLTGPLHAFSLITKIPE